MAIQRFNAIAFSSTVVTYKIICEDYNHSRTKLPNVPRPQECVCSGSLLREENDGVRRSRGELQGQQELWNSKGSDVWYDGGESRRGRPCREWLDGIKEWLRVGWRRNLHTQQEGAGSRHVEYGGEDGIGHLRC